MLLRYPLLVINLILQESYSSITDLELMHSVLTALLNMRPNQNDAVLTPIWSKLVGIAFTRYAKEAIQTDSKIPGLLSQELIDAKEAALFQSHNDSKLPKLVGDFVSGSFVHILSNSTSDIVLASTAKAFASVAQSCITDGMISLAYLGAQETSGNPLFEFIKVVEASLKDIRYRDILGGILNISGCLFEVFL